MNDDGRGPALPYDKISGAIGDNAAAKAELDALHAHLAQPSPNRAQVEGHVDRLRGVRDAGAHVANWFDSPETQRWIMRITDAGL